MTGHDAMTELSDAVASFVDDAGTELVDRVVAKLENGGTAAAVVMLGPQAALLRDVNDAAARAQVNDTSLALAIRAAKAADQRASHGLVDVVWTGPSTQRVPTRRTRQLLEQLIRGANREIWIVSYHVLGAKSIIEAATERARAGVRTKLLVETIDEGQRNLKHVHALGELADVGDIYEWPLDKRKAFAEGSQWVTLHAKSIVIDARELFVSSANLTSRALDRNMELGLHVSGGDAPKRVAEHLDALVASGTLVPIRDRA